MLRTSVFDTVHRKRALQLALLSLLASSVLAVLTGCGMGKIDSTFSPEPVTGAALQGRVHGGNFPVSNSNIVMWAAGTNGVYGVGTSGYGTGSASIMNAGVTVMTDSNGSFSLNGTNGADYTCPDPTTPVYITASGGNPGLTPAAGTTIDNGQLVLMAALGPCGNLTSSTFIEINEITTVASAYALAQFASVNPTGTGIVVGTSGSNIQGLTNAMATVNNLVDIGTGTARTITPFYSGAYFGNANYPYAPQTPVAFLNTSTVPQARINTLANILASCVNTAPPTGSVDGSTLSAQCGSLMAAATPPNGTAPGDTLQAILDIALNPGNNVGTLFNLAGGTGAFFQPSITGTGGPDDWTLALTYTAGGLGRTANYPDYQESIVPLGMQIDANGDVLVAAGDGYNENQVILAELDPLGQALTPATTVAGTVTTLGGFAPQYTTGNNAGAYELLVLSPVLDKSGNLWQSGQSFLEVATGPNPYIAQTIPIAYPYTKTVMNFDANGYIWVEQPSPSSNSTIQIAKYNTSGTLAAAYTAPTNTLFTSINFDANNNLFAAGTKFYAISTSNGSVLASYPLPNFNGSTQIAGDSLGNMYVCDQNSGTTVSVYNVSQKTTGPETTYAAGANGCYDQPSLDGLANLFMYGYTSQTILQKMSSTGAILSGANGYDGSGSAEQNGGFSILSNESGVITQAVDGSGNLWVLNSDTGYTGTPSPTSEVNNVLAEFIGLAAPVMTPTALALYNGELATRP